MIELFLITAAVALAYANGANDNFKGVATVYGAGVLSFQSARIVATVATLCGAIIAIVLAESLARAFSGRGLVSAALVSSPLFACAVAVGAATTVFIATRIGMPISTTHTLVGGLAGVGFFVAPDAMNGGALIQQFVLPLAAGPLVALALSLGLNAWALRFWREPVAAETCICVVPAQIATAAQASALSPRGLPTLAIGTNESAQCKAAAHGGLNLSLSTQSNMDRAHIVSAFLVCFARALNDAPKIVGLLLVAKTLSAVWASTLVALAMTLGGWLHSRKTAHTMAHRITPLAPRNAFIANIATALLVINASRFGLPLSTTHVSVGAITGTKPFNSSRSHSTPPSALRAIILSWLATLPISAAISVAAYCLLSFAFFS